MADADVSISPSSLPVDLSVCKRRKLVEPEPEPCDRETEAGSDKGKGRGRGRGAPPENDTDYIALANKLNAQFNERYTDEDVEFVATVKKPLGRPPCVYPWYNKPRRNFNYTKNSRFQNHSEYKRQWNDNSRDNNRRHWDSNQGGRYEAGGSNYSSRGRYN